MDAVIEVSDLTKRFGTRAAVDGLSFAVPEGSVFGLLGPNGAGKSTTIRMLLGLAKPTSGNVQMLGRALGDRTYHESLHDVGSMIEGPALWTALRADENLRIHARYLGLGDAVGRIGEVLELVGLAARSRDRVKTYSMGMKQRLALAIALLGRPKVAILDEPLNGLDPAGIAELRTVVKRLPSQGTTVVVSSHLLGEVEMTCDEVAIIDRGRLVASGPTASIVEQYSKAQYRVVFAHGEAQAAAATLTAAGLRGSFDAAGALIVDASADEIDGRRIGWLLSQADIWPDQIVRETASLEDVFLSLTTPVGSSSPVAGAEPATGPTAPPPHGGA